MYPLHNLVYIFNLSLSCINIYTYPPTPPPPHSLWHTLLIEAWKPRAFSCSKFGLNPIDSCDPMLTRISFNNQVVHHHCKNFSTQNFKHSGFELEHDWETRELTSKPNSSCNISVVPFKSSELGTKKIYKWRKKLIEPTEWTKI